MRRLVMDPAPGERLLRFVGDRLRFSLRDAEGGSWHPGWRACLRTNLGRAAAIRAEIIASVRSHRPPTLASWRDIPLAWRAGEWTLDVALTEVGYFRGKAYAIDPRGWQHWPSGPDAGITVQPDAYRTANTIYCAFTRLFGSTKTAVSTPDPAADSAIKRLDKQGYTVIPPSGKFRDLIQELPHIFDTLGCRILHLLPVNPTPTTCGRFGRFGSPYACEDLTAIDPALVEFDRRTTGIDQFRELAYAVHSRGGRLFLDMVINHTGWGARLQEEHPEWFLRGPDGAFASPGAWGVTWEDLVELEHGHPELREYLAEAFLEWCRRGVDGFRCDAGYKVPAPVWQYITARVRQEFPETIFLLEGLGGGWDDTAHLLTEGGLQWAYSELFQNYAGSQVAGYLDHAHRQSARVGLLIHYSETHDNLRLAARGRAWSQLRNHLCALTSVAGGYGFTCGVEWLAAERIDVHASRGLAWGAANHLLAELGRLNRLLADHPCFFDGARLTRLSPADSPVYALLRVSADNLDAVLVLVNTDADQAHPLSLDPLPLREAKVLPAQGKSGVFPVDLLGQALPPMTPARERQVLIQLGPGAAHCLAPASVPHGLRGEAYRRVRAQAAFALTALNQAMPLENVGIPDTHELAQWVDGDPAGFLGALTYLDAAQVQSDLISALRAARQSYPRVVRWALPDRTRVLLIPPGHWLLVEDEGPFRATLESAAEAFPVHTTSIPVCHGHVACFPPRQPEGRARLRLERYSPEKPHVEAAVQFLPSAPQEAKVSLADCRSAIVLLTNGLGGMARLGVDLGAIQSKYDCLLAANLHPRVPVDRHVLAKRARVWVNADGFLSPLNLDNLAEFEPGPPARWRFVANAGDGRVVAIHLQAEMLAGRNAILLRFTRPAEPPSEGVDLSAGCDVRLTVRVDIEDRNFHWETKRNGGAEHHFASHCHPLPDKPGFGFTPASDRGLQVFSDHGNYHPQPEWSENIPHPVEQSRGQTASGDAYSPGWFEIPLPKGARATLSATAHPDPAAGASQTPEPKGPSALEGGEAFDQRLLQAARAFLVRRDDVKTVIAGYPWFLDWGRDTLICARGLLAAGLVAEVREILQAFGRFEQGGTLPNTIHGEAAGNRDTSDAPLWYGVVCEEAAAGGASAAAPSASAGSQALYRTVVNASGRSIAEVLRSIANGYLHGTANGIRMDAASALIWSPSHFTWMDTNYPACTPREGYPVEIQALWIRLLRQLDRLGALAVSEPWGALARRAQESLERFFWLEARGYYADVLLARAGQAAAAAQPDSALRSNGLFVVSLGLAQADRGRRCVEAARRWLVAPGALRSLAPRPVSPPLPLHAPDGRPLNNPAEPYWGRYEGDEDTCRKPAYHNGTAWTWTFPVFCEALARAWDFAPPAVAAAKAYLGSMSGLMGDGCVGHIPEILDGDAPHRQRGCDAQAWGATEALRVWRLLQTHDDPQHPR